MNKKTSIRHLCIFFTANLKVNAQDMCVRMYIYIYQSLCIDHH